MHQLVELFVEAWRSGGAVPALLLLAVVALARQQAQQERLYERLIERADRPSGRGRAAEEKDE